MNATSCVSTMNDCSHDPLLEHRDSLTGSTRISLLLYYMQMRWLLCQVGQQSHCQTSTQPQTNCGLPTVRVPELLPTNHRLPAVEPSQNCQQYPPRLLLFVLTFIQQPLKEYLPSMGIKGTALLSETTR